jgi:hypothetical protein
MSTVAYANLTTKREQAAPGTSSSQSPPGVRSFVDALAALVPAEVLTLHGLILSFTTKTENVAGISTTTITDKGTLSAAFFGLVVLSIVLYAVPRSKTWERMDFFRASIPPLAFVAWTMLQKATAFDAVVHHLPDGQRSLIALFVAVILGVAAAALANSADQKVPQVQVPSFQPQGAEPGNG